MSPRTMETALEKTPYLIGNDYTIADISLYAYTHVADEGKFDLTAFSAIDLVLKRAGLKLSGRGALSSKSHDLLTLQDK